VPGVSGLSIPILVILAVPPSRGLAVGGPTCMARRPLHFQEPNPHSRHKPTLPSSMVCARATWHTHQTGNIRSRLGQFPTNLVERRRYPGDLGVEPRRRIQDLSTPESDPPHFSHLDGGRKAAPIRLETCQYL
jgi:hypothetical protein